MLEEHGLTLPPETQALRGFGRKGQTTHRWKALADTRVALRKRKLLRWVRPGPHRGAVAEVGPGVVSGADVRRLLHRSEVGANLESSWA